ncbi:MAG: tRNA (N6-threonylcarbamoyladenosine(37)-N6)-methyltransferase TrmO [Desulfobulbus sp.]
MNIIARIHTDLKTKFGIPRQSGLVASLKGKIIFEPEYRSLDAVRGLEDFSHIWLIWQFSAAVREKWSPTVRPPRLGGDKRMGVFATRSPFRPNAIGLSSVSLDQIEFHSVLGPILWVSGVDLLDNTPLYDIKPYLAYTDSHPEATGGFTQTIDNTLLTVDFPPHQIKLIPPGQREALIGVLANDPRPRYQNDPQRIYGFEFSRWNVQFKVVEDVLTVLAVTPLENE